MVSNCSKCSEQIKSLNFLECQGFCGGMFHLSCTSLTRQTMTSVNESPNLLWFCDNCVTLMKTPQLRTAFTALSEAFSSLSEAHSTALENVRKEIQHNSKQVEVLASKLSAGAPSTPVWPNPNRRTNKRRLTSTQDSPQKLDLPKSSRGKKVMTGSTVPIITSSSPVPDDKWWIWLASFPPSVTEEDIRLLVKENLSCSDDDTIDVKLLVKKGVDVSNLRSVTFKVGVEMKYRDATLDDDTWPEGIVFREFIQLEKKQLASGSGFSKTPRLD